MNHRSVIFTLLVTAITGCGGQVTKIEIPEVTPDELRAHVRYLASDELEGRGSGTRGNDLAAEYIAGQFRDFNLLPAGDNGTFFQTFPFVSGAEHGPNNSLSLTYAGKSRSLILDEEFRTLAFSSDSSVSGELVFAGYGITDSSEKYDDFDGIDVTGNIAVVLRYSPRGDDPHSPFTEKASLRAKSFNAREHGAAGLLLVTGPVDNDKAEPLPFSFERGFGTAGIPVMSIGWNTLSEIFSASGRDLKAVQEGINENQKPSSFPLGATAAMQTEIVKITAESRNVIGAIPGNDPVLKNEYIVIGAHFDHLGMGGPGSLAPDIVAPHHGADDNASGTAGLIEVAEYFSWHRTSLKRSLLFMGFSGEEGGLLGSAYFVKNPTVDIGMIKTMINMDMIGRLTDDKLVVEGIGTSPGFEEMMKSLNADSSFKLSLKPDGFGPSDQASFYGKDIPVLFFFTNLHSDYHKPSDTWDKINYEGETRVVQLVCRVVEKLDAEKEAPSFVRVSTPTPQGGGRGQMRVSLGVVPDYADDGTGFKISGTRPDSPADRGGLKGGDVIMKFGDKTITNIYDFTYALQEHAPGDVVEVLVKRGEETLTLTVTLEGR